MINLKRQLFRRSQRKGSSTIIYIVIIAIIVLAVVVGILYYLNPKSKQAKTDCENQNTSSSCLKYTYNDSSNECLSQPIIPCCGNSTCETGEKSSCIKDCQVTFEQTQKDTSYPVKFNTYRNDFQKVAQTFVPTENDLNLTSVEPYIDFSLGEKAFFTMYELDDPQKPTSGKLLKNVELNIADLPRQNYYLIKIDPAIPVSKDKTYSFVIEVQSKTSELGIGKISYQDLFKDGKAYYYFSLVGGNGEILEEKFDWRYDKDDLTFKLNFLKSGASS